MIAPLVVAALILTAMAFRPGSTLHRKWGSAPVGVLLLLALEVFVAWVLGYAG